MAENKERFIDDIVEGIGETVSMDSSDKKSNLSKLNARKKIIIAFIVFLLIGGVGGAGFSSALLVYLYKSGRISGEKVINNITEKVTVDEGSGVIDAVKKISPSVVSIATSSKAIDIFGRAVQQDGGGTGFVVTNDGLILTNKHVVSGANSLKVITDDGKDYEGKVVAVDPLFDFALVKIDAKGLTVVDLGDSDSLEIGQRVVAVGNALGEYQNSVTVGVISARSRAIVASDASGGSSFMEGLIQTDAPISPGNSGGPLVNIKGQVIGINTAVDSQGNSIGFAIPINSGKVALNSYLKNGRIVRSYIGIRYVNITKDYAAKNNLDITSGALIVGEGRNALAVVPGSPADKAGLKENDIITAVDGEKIMENKSIISILSNYSPGQIIEVTYLRKGEEAKTKVTLAEMKQ